MKRPREPRPQLGLRPPGYGPAAADLPPEMLFSNVRNLTNTTSSQHRDHPIHELKRKLGGVSLVAHVARVRLLKNSTRSHPLRIFTLIQAHGRQARMNSVIISSTQTRNDSGKTTSRGVN